MTYSPLLIIHICGGIAGVFSGATALFVRKGSRLHRRSGDVFVIAMLIMGSSGAVGTGTAPAAPTLADTSITWS